MRIVLATCESLLGVPFVFRLRFDLRLMDSCNF